PTPSPSTPRPAAAPSTPAAPVYHGSAPALLGTLTAADVDGDAFLQGGNYEYLGIVSSSKTDPKSICNNVGTYGSRSSATSIRNPESAYGRGPGGPPDAHFNSRYSAYNPDAGSPPRIVWEGEIVGYLTTGPAVGAIDPDALLAFYGCPR
ncbi:MAG: hypothetical protein O3C25_02920, partial [Chloroflexi bacterium]|nr:hypothetical protein [Chloroflexota bacterium]